MPSLTPEEVDQLKKKIGTGATPMTQCVAKLYICPPGGTQWKDTGIWGATAVVIDRTPPTKSAHIQIYDMKTWELRFNQELYEAMPYAIPNPQFHTFEIDRGLVGLSFCDKEEAEVFVAKIRTQTPKPTGAAGRTSSASISQAEPETRKKSGSVLQSISGAFTGLFGGKRKATVSIGAPTNFQHKQHIGYDPEKGFECGDIPDQWKSIFRNAGVRKQDLQNPDTAKVIFETLSSALGEHSAEEVSGNPEELGVHHVGAGGQPLGHANTAYNIYGDMGGDQPEQITEESAEQVQQEDEQQPEPEPEPEPEPVVVKAPPVIPVRGAPAKRGAAPPPPMKKGATPTKSPETSVPVPPEMSAPEAPAFEAPPMEEHKPVAPVKKATPVPVKKAAPAPVATPQNDHLSLIQQGIKLKKVDRPDHKSALPDLSNLSGAEKNSLQATLQGAMARMSALKGKVEDAEKKGGGKGDDDWD